MKSKPMRKRLVVTLIVVWAGLSGCKTAATLPPSTITPSATLEPSATPSDTPTPRPTAAPICTTWVAPQVEPAALGWWNQSVFYELFVRSFYDSDGDGIGDFNGIRQKLDYLNDGDPTSSQDLGITAIWLMPIHPSASYHGYDVTDYMDVNPEYGTLEEFKLLLDEAHQRGIRVIIDLVLNHTSTQHPWFVESAASVDNPYRDYYIWTETPPSFKSPWGSDVWYKLETGYYYGVFWAGMPDLNYNNPAVTAEAYDVIRFWLEDIGVDGFRLDGIKHLIEEGSNQENTGSTHAWWQGFYDFYTGINPDAFTVGEAWSTTAEVVRYIGDEVNIAFEFDTANAMVASAAAESNQSIREAHQVDVASYPLNQYGTFLTNHDQGRVMSVVNGNLEKAKTAASLLLTGPGVPFLFYGEEVGQKGNKPDENIRTPMQWSAQANAGFTTADLPWRRPQKDYEERNLADQQGDPDSLFNHYRSLIHLRTKFPALLTGDFLELPTADRRIYAYLRTTIDQTLLVITNLGRNPIQDYRFCLQGGPLVDGTAQEIWHQTSLNPPLVTANGGFDDYRPVDVLEPYTTYIIELQ